MAPSRKSRKQEASASASASSTQAPAPTKGRRAAKATEESRGTRTEPAEPKVKRALTAPVTDETTGDVSFAEVDLSTHESVNVGVKSWLSHLRHAVTSLNGLTDESNKAYARLAREVNRKRTKRVVDPNKPKKLSTFTWLMKVRPEVNTFMGQPKGTYVSRTQLTSAVSEYVKKNNCKFTEGERKGEIRPDKQLNLVLAKEAVNKKTGVKYNNITNLNVQALLNHNFLERAPDADQPDPEEVAAESAARKARRAASKTTEAAPTEERTRKPRKGDAVAAPAPAGEEEVAAKKPSRKAAASAPAPSKGRRRAAAVEDGSDE
jgi:SWIB/MDM2 domain